MPVFYPITTFHVGSNRSKVQGRKTEVTEGGFVWSRRYHNAPVYNFKLIHKFLTQQAANDLDAFLRANDNFDMVFRDGITYRVVIGNAEWSKTPLNHDGSTPLGYWTMEIHVVGSEVLPPVFDVYFDSTEVNFNAGSVTLVDLLITHSNYNDPAIDVGFNAGSVTLT